MFPGELPWPLAGQASYVACERAGRGEVGTLQRDASARSAMAQAGPEDESGLSWSQPRNRAASTKVPVSVHVLQDRARRKLGWGP